VDQLVKEQHDEASLKKFKAKKIPKHVHMNLYEQMLDQEEEKRQAMER
jgi:Uncharacterised protein family UPF0564